MNKWVSRSFIFFIGFPLLVGVMIFDFGNHLVANLTIVFFSALGAMETGSLLALKGFPINFYMRPILGASLPILAYLEVMGLTDASVTLVVVSLLVGMVFVRQIYTNQDPEIQLIANKVSGNLLVLIYPGLFLYYLVKVSGLDHATIALPVFFFITFGNDAMAFTIGSLLGKKSKKPFVVSPNKSTVGFVGGLLISVVMSVAAQMIWPNVFGPLWMIIIMSLLWGAMTILGDLFESALKRSVGAKDSGNLIPGRGGVLDSIDSLLFTVPTYYYYLYYVQNLSL
ncbi:MAG: hypothetical protein A2Z96_02590 [Spirochaetes bacterium GWB1_48_6]|nr:MAG: hypothetical protein A2Z96_02590 [Spirochaetes bacterium GWB1_48_6]